MNRRLLYIANVRMPTEKAHGLQIMQNCEAFADAGAEVTLWVARRFNTPEMKIIHDPWAYYGVKRNFTLRRIPCIDLMPLVPGRTDLLGKLAFYIQQTTFVLVALLLALFTPAAVYYSRDPLTLFGLSLLKPRHRLIYEAHTLAAPGGGRQTQRRVVARVGHTVAVTDQLKTELVKLVGGTANRCHVAPDGIRRERFMNMPSQAEARAALGWPPGALIVGYTGRLQTMAMDKGVGTLIAALAQVEDAALALVGGPDDIAENFRQQWLQLGLDPGRFLYSGHVPPDRVPLYLSAFDLCAMPFPWTEHFAYYASPIKLFEYMAARRAIIASDLPALAGVVTEGESALLVPPGDVGALAGAITRLRDDPALRHKLADRAYAIVMARYTWDARARAVLAACTDISLPNS